MHFFIKILYAIKSIIFSWLSKVLEPSITMSLQTDDGELKTFEVPLAQFHQLRYTTADLLQRMSEIQSTQTKKESLKNTSS